MIANTHTMRHIKKSLIGLFRVSELVYRRARPAKYFKTWNVSNFVFYVPKFSLQ